MGLAQQASRPQAGVDPGGEPGAQPSARLVVRQQPRHGVGQRTRTQIFLQALEGLQRSASQGDGFFWGTGCALSGAWHSCLNANGNFVKVPALCGESLGDPRSHLT